MSGLRIVVESSGDDIISDRLDDATHAIKNPVAAAQAAAEWMAGETFRIFENAFNADGPWTPISKITAFIRAHRANSPRHGNQPGSDSGRLKGSFTPDWSSDGTQFGAGTNVEYAPAFNEGGPSEENTVAIAGFKRSNTKKKIKDYLMTIKAGHDVPARQYFPKGLDELQSWGYIDKIKEIFALDFNNRLGGTA